MSLQVSFNLKRKWMLIVSFTAFMALLPLLVMTLMDFRLTRQVIEDEVKKGMIHTVTTIAQVLSTQDPKTVPGPEELEQTIGKLLFEQEGDIFVMGEKGALLTPSYHLGPPGAFMPPPAPGRPAGIELRRFLDDTFLVAFARSERAGLTVVQITPEKTVIDLWLTPRLKLLVYLCLSILIILISIIAMATYLMERIHRANRHWIEALHHEEHATRLASIGRLASGVAHEINNPLEIINQKTGLILDLLSLGKEGHHRLPPLANDVLAAVKRCSTITRQLLDFARHLEPSIEPVDTLEILGQILPLLKADAEQRGIRITLDHPAALPKLECDRSSLQQIFLNLAENAITAMAKGGGHLNIKIRPMAETSIEITVSDTGKGISKADQKKIFEPFYSTKEEGWGAGLGLAITYGLIKEMGGDIRVESEPNRGSRFILTLPLVASQTELPGTLPLPAGPEPENYPQKKGDTDDTA